MNHCNHVVCVKIQQSNANNSNSIGNNTEKMQTNKKKRQKRRNDCATMYLCLYRASCCAEWKMPFC